MISKILDKEDVGQIKYLVKSSIKGEQWLINLYSWAIFKNRILNPNKTNQNK